MNSQLAAVCKQLGLHESEAKIFSILIMVGATKVAYLSSTSGMNRATIYHALSGLEQKGLVHKEMINGSYEFRVTDSSALDAYFNNEVQQIETAKENIKSLLTLFQKNKRTSAESHVQVFQGENGVKNAFELAFQAKSKKWSVIAPKDNFLVHVDEVFTERYIKKRSTIMTKTLWESPDEKPTLPKTIIMQRNVRFLPKEFWKKFTSLIILYDNSALFVSPYREQKATLVSSEDVISTLRVLFDLAWENGILPKSLE
jgi:sugar-specific transcriptional regulator TrmB